jgi:hypothetical protein
MGGPPGEKEILRLNPQRRLTILEVTGWSRLENGSLNLSVNNHVVENLLVSKPAFVEKGESITYPEGYKHIPLVRKAYYYYRAVACANGLRHDVLVRRAQVALPGRVELFAENNLTQVFGLREGDAVEVELTAEPLSG